MEEISNAVYEGGKVKFSVISNGCTSQSDFIVEYQVNEGRCELTIDRTKADLCRMTSSLVGIEIEWTLPVDCDGMEVIFVNPVVDKLPQSFERTLRTE